MTSKKSNGKFKPEEQLTERTLNEPMMGGEIVKKELPPEMAVNIWKPGQSGNPAGKAKVRNTIKDQLRYELERELRVYTTRGEMKTKAVRQVARNLISVLAFGEVSFPSKVLGGKSRRVVFDGNDWANHAVKILKYYEPAEEKSKEPTNFMLFDIMNLLPKTVKDNILKVQGQMAEAADERALPSVIEGVFIDDAEMAESKTAAEQWWAQEQDENDEEARLMQELIEEGVETIDYDHEEPDIEPEIEDDDEIL